MCGSVVTSEALEIARRRRIDECYSTGNAPREKPCREIGGFSTNPVHAALQGASAEAVVVPPDPLERNLDEHQDSMYVSAIPRPETRRKTDMGPAFSIVHRYSSCLAKVVFYFLCGAILSWCSQFIHPPRPLPKYAQLSSYIFATPKPSCQPGLYQAPPAPPG